MASVGAGALNNFLKEALSPCLAQTAQTGFDVPQTYLPAPTWRCCCSSAQNFTWKNSPWPSGLTFDVLSLGRHCLIKLAAFPQCPCTNHSQPSTPAFCYHCASIILFHLFVYICLASLALHWIIETRELLWFAQCYTPAHRTVPHLVIAQ